MEIQSNTEPLQSLPLRLAQTLTKNRGGGCRTAGVQIGYIPATVLKGRVGETATLGCIFPDFAEHGARTTDNASPVTATPLSGICWGSRNSDRKQLPPSSCSRHRSQIATASPISRRLPPKPGFRPELPHPSPTHPRGWKPSVAPSRRCPCSSRRMDSAHPPSSLLCGHGHCPAPGQVSGTRPSRRGKRLSRRIASCVEVLSSCGLKATARDSGGGPPTPLRIPLAHKCCSPLTISQRFSQTRSTNARHRQGSG